MALFELWTDHACFTGDCDHAKGWECVDSLKRYVTDLCDEAKEINSQRDDLLASCEEAYWHYDRSQDILHQEIKKAKGK